MTKFAPITSSLLARKGSAGPSIVPLVKLPFLSNEVSEQAEIGVDTIPAVEHIVRRPFTEIRSRLGEPSGEPGGPGEPRGSGEPKGPREPNRSAGPGGTGSGTDRPRKISVALSPREHETLGIIAVKRGVTRHQVVRNALDAYFETLAREYRTQCSCIANGCSCAGECSAA